MFLKVIKPCFHIEIIFHRPSLSIGDVQNQGVHVTTTFLPKEGQLERLPSNLTLCIMIYKTY